MATPNSRQQKKQKMYQLQREVEELRKQVEKQKNDDSLQNVSVSQAITDWIWSTRFDKN